MGLYCPTNKFAIAAQCCNVEQVKNAGNKILDTIKSELATTSIITPIEVHLRGGSDNNESVCMILAIHEFVKSADLPMKIISENILKASLGNNGTCSLLIDSKTGAVTSYDPKLNPHGRNYLKITTMNALRHDVAEEEVMIVKAWVDAVKALKSNSVTVQYLPPTCPKW